MGVHSGKFARVNGVDTMRRWSIDEVEKQPKAVASNTLMGTARRKGVRSWTGSYEAYGAKPIAGAMPGSLFSFEGYGAPANDVSGNGLLYQGDAVVRSLAVKWDWKSGAIISHTVQFDGHLQLAKVSGADPGDAVPPNLPEIGGCKVKFAMYDSATFADLPAVTEATLTVSAQVEDYVNSDTYVAGRLWTGRKSGPVDWSLSVGQQDEERLTGIFDAGDFVKLKLGTLPDNSEFWELKYGIVRDFTGIKADRESGEIIGRTINIDMNAYYGSAAGFVKEPGATTWWPF